ncbi:MAG: 4Fe-4S binding protein [Spirochaetales bacterium]|nr:4Fe-4S binding protein [Spirochaetales bacterium]
MIREIITIDEEKCTGCGLCIPNCPEGALQVIDGKARLVSDLFCDGLGACIGHCPEGAITVEKREAEPYDERRVMANIVRQGAGTIAAHLKHLEDHGEDELLAVAKVVLEEKGITLDAAPESGSPAVCAAEAAAIGHTVCPGSISRQIARPPRPETASPIEAGVARPSELTHWPVQLHLIPAGAPWLKGRDLLLCADCVGYAAGDFHGQYLKGKALAIACPKLDSGLDVYLQKLTAIIENGGITSLDVLMMQVPCCRGLLHLAQRAAAAAQTKVPVRYTVVSIAGEVLETAQVC